jgi:hypothetical protein
VVGMMDKLGLGPVSLHGGGRELLTARSCTVAHIASMPPVINPCILE